MALPATQSALLAEITAAFKDEPYPGDEALVAENTAISPAGRTVRDTLQGHLWQEVSDDALATVQTSLSALSAAGFHYYLPAFMCSVLQDGSGVGKDISEVIRLLKLPTEVSDALVTEQIQRFEMAGNLPVADLEEMLQQQLALTNAAIKAFMTRAGRFTKAQGQAVYHFLVYVQDNYGDAFLRAEAGLALQRYWFQFG